MKKLLFIIIAACGMYAADAQVINVPGRPTKIPKSVFSSNPTVVVSRTMGNYPEGAVNVRVWIEDAGESGYQVKFSANNRIERMEINRSEPQQVLNTLTLAPNQTAGSFNMDAPAYKGSNTYRIVFYGPNLPKGMWTALIQRKVS